MSDADPLTWARDALRAVGVAVRGVPVARAVNVWSSVWALRTDAGTYWLKAGRPGEGHAERILASLAADLVLAPLATEPVRGWLLAPDGGTTMETYLSGREDLDPEWMCRLVRDYADLQRSTFEHRPVLESAGIPVADPLLAAEVARAQADCLARFPEGDPRHLPAADHQRVVEATPRLLAAGTALVRGPVPLGLDHGDLATRNVFLPRTGGRHRFFDFSDARWAHPFESMAMLLWECVRRWRIVMPADVIDLRDTRIRTVLDAYLSCWSELAAGEELRDLAGHALRLAPLHRSGVWLRTLAAAETAAVTRHGRTPWAWLQDVTKPVLL
jgi:hypothetical protein